MKADGQLPADTGMRSSKYLIEQDHRGAKLRVVPMLGFKRSRTAAITIVGVELLRGIHKGQFDLGGLHLKDRSTPAAWSAALVLQLHFPAGPDFLPLDNKRDSGCPWRGGQAHF
jgi:hypothetical protein